MLPGQIWIFFLKNLLYEESEKKKLIHFSKDDLMTLSMIFNIKSSLMKKINLDNQVYYNR